MGDVFLQKCAVPCVSWVPWTKQHHCFQTAIREGKRKSSRGNWGSPKTSFTIPKHWSGTLLMFNQDIAPSPPFFFSGSLSVKDFSHFWKHSQDKSQEGQTIAFSSCFRLLLLILDQCSRNLEEAFCWAQFIGAIVHFGCIVIFQLFLIPAFIQIKGFLLWTFGEPEGFWS